MQLSVKFLTRDIITVEIYQATLGNVDILLATLKNPLEELKDNIKSGMNMSESDDNMNYTSTNTTTDSAKSTSLFDVCLPQGTYSIVFVVKTACSASTCGQPLFNFLGFNTNNDSDICSSSAVDMHSSGRKRSLLITISLYRNFKAV
jgi:hypothetical protein